MKINTILGKQPPTRTEDIHVICYKAYCYWYTCDIHTNPHPVLS